MWRECCPMLIRKLLGLNDFPINLNSGNRAGIGLSRRESSGKSGNDLSRNLGNFSWKMYKNLGKNKHKNFLSTIFINLKVKMYHILYNGSIF